MGNDKTTTVEERLDEHLARYPHLVERIYRELLMSIHRRQIASIDSVHDEARARIGRSATEAGDDPNQAERDRWDELERSTVEAIAREHARDHLTLADIDDLVNLTLKREEVQTLEHVANRGQLPFRELAEHVQRFCEIPLGETVLDPAEVVGTRVALTRHFVSDQLEFLGIAKNHLTIRDFDDITRRIVGSDNGMGRIGGKAGGMVLAHRILAAADEDKKPYLPVAMPESYFLRSDVVEDFLSLNRLDQYQTQKYKPIDDVTREYPLIRGVFRNGDFPLRIVHSLRDILSNLGNHPLIVRSSSLLEDRFGTAFTGKYASVFVPNQGTLEQRLHALLGAIAEVFASVMGPDPITYRREHRLLDYVEEMAVLIQKVVGFHHGNYFLPAFAGVAFSKNEYRWSPRIKREDGLLRIVMGLGTRAVDRSGSDYPRMVALGEPTLRPESTVQEIMRGSQQTLDVIDLASNKLRSVRLKEVLKDDISFPHLDKIISTYSEGGLYEPTSTMVNADPDDMHITFNKLLHTTPFAQRVREMLARLEDAYGVPVDMEFASDGERFYVLQCRTLSQFMDEEPVTIPEDVDKRDVLFEAHSFVRTGNIRSVEHIVFVDPAGYDSLPSRQQRVDLARLIGRVNRALPSKSFMLLGPGRWGSRDIMLGVPVSYADINHCCLLIEIGRKKGGFVPELSFGTHFFQDLVEADIHYLPIYPDDETDYLNEGVLSSAPNKLTDVVSDAGEFASVLRVISVSSISRGRRLAVVMDGESDHALAYMKP